MKQFFIFVVIVFSFLAISCGSNKLDKVYFIAGQSNPPPELDTTREMYSYKICIGTIGATTKCWSGKDLINGGPVLWDSLAKVLRDIDMKRNSKKL